ncbi:MAG: hypothetical protein V5A68_00420 [Candidatus Thermoplasmatota archaeon]
MKKSQMELTEGSKYKVTSIGGKNKVLETTGILKGFMSIGIEENAIMMELTEENKEREGKIRIIPLHVILAIDIIDLKENNEKDDVKETSHYVG